MLYRIGDIIQKVIEGNQTLAAGTSAGRAWASSANALSVARLRSWCPWLIEGENWDYRYVYASVLTNKIVTDNTGKAGDDDELLAIEQAGYEAISFWRDVTGWPEDRNEWWSFVEGFVRGVAESADQ